MNQMAAGLPKLVLDHDLYAEADHWWLEIPGPLDSASGNTPRLHEPTPPRRKAIWRRSSSTRRNDCGFASVTLASVIARKNQRVPDAHTTGSTPTVVEYLSEQYLR